MDFRPRWKDEGQRHGLWPMLDGDEFVAVLLSWVVVVAGAFVIILIDTWLGIVLVAAALVAYFVLSILHIGSSRRRVADQLADFERRKHGSSGQAL